MNYFNKNSNIKDEVNVTYSSHGGGNDPFRLFKYNDPGDYFETASNDSNSWICFEFKNHQIIPSDYIIKSYCSESNWHLKSWILEGSNDRQNWSKLDEQQNNSSLNGSSRIFSSPVSNKNKQSFKYIQIRITGQNWSNNYGIMMNSIEFYGKVI